jgi:hypothetical protein
MAALEADRFFWQMHCQYGNKGRLIKNQIRFSRLQRLPNRSLDWDVQPQGEKT